VLREHNYYGKIPALIKEVERVMTPSKAAKKAGLKSLKQMGEISDTTTATLRNWFNNNPKRFYTMLEGCVSTLREESAKCLINILGAELLKKGQKLEGEIPGFEGTLGALDKIRL